MLQQKSNSTYFRGIMHQTNKKKIIFISHDSTLTGAPIVLLHLIEIVKSKNEYDFEIILLKGGILEEDFQKLGKVHLLRPSDYNKRTFFLWKFFPYLKYRNQLKVLSKTIGKADLILSNTVTNGKLLDYLAPLKIPVITYVHELENIIQIYKKKSSLTFKYSNQYIVPSNAVLNNLIQNHGIQRNCIHQVNSYFEVRPNAPGSNEKEAAKRTIFPSFDFRPECFYVVGMGAATHRKGIDLLVKAAAMVHKTESRIHFVWIGNFDDKKLKEEIESEIRMKHLHEAITFIGQIPHTLQNLIPFDLFVLPSREDPYPLVVLEAALAGLPSVIFEKAGGIKEFVSEDCGWQVNEISGEAMAEKILQIYADSNEVKVKGAHAFQKCLKLHGNKEYIYNQFKDSIKSVMR